MDKPSLETGGRGRDTLHGIGALLEEFYYPGFRGCKLKSVLLWLRRNPTLIFHLSGLTFAKHLIIEPFSASPSARGRMTCGSPTDQGALRFQPRQRTHPATFFQLHLENLRDKGQKATRPNMLKSKGALQLPNAASRPVAIEHLQPYSLSAESSPSAATNDLDAIASNLQVKHPQFRIRVCIAGDCCPVIGIGVTPSF
jgi:hypothetical protein